MSVITGRRLTRIRNRANRNRIPFALQESDIVVPETCPVLGIPLDNSTPDRKPCVDKIVPELGYTPGNVIVISDLANRIKTNATPDQIIAVGTFYKRLIQERANA